MNEFDNLNAINYLIVIFNSLILVLGFWLLIILNYSLKIYTQIFFLHIRKNISLIRQKFIEIQASWNNLHSNNKIHVAKFCYYIKFQNYFAQYMLSVSLESRERTLYGSYFLQRKETAGDSLNKSSKSRY